MRNGCGVRAAFLALLVWTGCGGPIDDLPRESVWGKVSFDGKPLATGAIQFLPDSGPGETQAGAMIRSGSYDIPRQEGPVPGTYRVVITSAVGAAALAGLPGRELPPPKELIPAKYNTKSDLTAEVKKGGESHFDFDLK
jgi:hypothetical protein